ncbi:MAG: ATP-grasp domain-containing protein [Lachnospiraceae bacterium]|nr:ATP-grasp domain-containing protein [Lachnospiraceae bacterium]
MNEANILITGTGSLIGQAIIKCIKKSFINKKIRIVGCDYFSGTVGSYWCEKNYLLPDLLDIKKVDEWKEKVISIIVKEKINILFIGVDFELEYFANMREELKNKYNCTVVVSDSTVIEIGNDKYKTYEFLVENGLNAPRTVLLEEAEIEKIVYPVIVKPRKGARSRGVKLVKNAREMEGIINTHVGQGFIIQEAIGTEQTEYTCGIIYMNNEFCNSIVLRRTLKEGNTATARFSGNKEQVIVDYIKDIGDRLTPFGSCNLQLRIGQDGKPYLFEINPRFSGTTHMRSLFGYNEVEYIVCTILGWEIPAMNLLPGEAYRYYDERLVE